MNAITADRVWVSLPLNLHSQNNKIAFISPATRQNLRAKESKSNHQWNSTRATNHKGIYSNYSIGFFSFFFSALLTRMHSSRMRTIHYSGHLGGGGCLPRGCLPRGEGVCPGGVCLGGCLPGGFCPGGGCLPRRGVSAQEGGVCSGVCTPSPPHGQTDTCENITFL